VPGTSFAIARVGAVIALSCGAILDLGICRYAGQGQGEVSLLRRLWNALQPGDVLLGDRLMSGWADMLLISRPVSASQSSAVSSRLFVSNCLPSGLNTTFPPNIDLLDCSAGGIADPASRCL
jgi:hypothetical protein